MVIETQSGVKVVCVCVQFKHIYLGHVHVFDGD